MNDPDNFFSRWSRRKREAGERQANEPREKGKNQGEAPTESADASAKNLPVADPAATPASKFDVESLPPVDSISEKTDITTFMRAGVPESLKRAALRRAWSADPAIRDFIGPNENYWDAAGPDGIAGFGDLDPGVDVQRMVSELFGEAPRKDVADQDPAAENAKRATRSMVETQPDEGQPPPAPSSPSPPGPTPSQPEKIAATQKESPEPEPHKKISRRHGGAMPR
jgi:hypothetical protein